MQVHVDRGGERFGPYSIENVNAYLADGTLLPTDLAWHDGMTDWVPIGEIPGVTMAEGSSPPAPVTGEETKPAKEKAEEPEAEGSDKISVTRGGEPIGPYSRDKAKEYFTAGQLLPTDWGWHDGMDEWKPLNEVLGLPLPAQSTGVTPARKKLVMQFVSFWLVVLLLMAGLLWNIYIGADIQAENFVEIRAGEDLLAIDVEDLLKIKQSEGVFSWSLKNVVIGNGFGFFFSCYLMFMFSITFYSFILKSRHTGKVRGIGFVEYLIKIIFDEYVDLACGIALLLVIIVMCWKLGNNSVGTDPGYIKFLKAVKDTTWISAISTCLAGIVVSLFRIIRKRREGWIKYVGIAVLSGVLVGSTTGFLPLAGKLEGVEKIHPIGLLYLQQKLREEKLVTDFKEINEAKARGDITEAQGESQRRNLQDRHESEIKKLNKQVHEQFLKMLLLATEKLDEDTKHQIDSINRGLSRGELSAGEADDEVRRAKRKAEHFKKALHKRFWIGIENVVKAHGVLAESQIKKLNENAGKN